MRHAVLIESSKLNSSYLTFLIDDGDVGDWLDLHGTLGPRQWVLKALKKARTHCYSCSKGNKCSAKSIFTVLEINNIDSLEQSSLDTRRL